jgi:predicted DCC family thiol-disulfide oxidoreductase YuxK
MHAAPHADSLHIREVVLFDGDCGFCQRSIRWIIRRDPRGIFRFASLQSPHAAKLLREQQTDRASLPDSMLLIDARGVHARSAAVIGIVSRLGLPWSILAMLKWVPHSVRDAAYDAFAKRRKKWFATPACWVPSPDERARFLSDALPQKRA